MPRKIYQTIGYLDYTQSLIVGGEKKRINFTGGHRVPYIRFGQFITKDKALQKALEAHELYNVSYKLIKVGEKSLIEPKVSLSLEEQLKEAREVNAKLQFEIEELSERTTADLSEELSEASKQVEEYSKQVAVLTGTVKEQEKTIKELKANIEVAEEEEVDIADAPTNMQAARQYLIKEHGQDIKTMKNGVDVLIVAEKCGVKFPNWNPKS